MNKRNKRSRSPSLGSIKPCLKTNKTQKTQQLSISEPVGGREELVSALGRGTALSPLRVQRELAKESQWNSKDSWGEKETTRG